MAAGGTLITFSRVFLDDPESLLKQRIWPYLIFLTGTIVHTLGSLMKENHFRQFEMSEKRFFGIDSFWQFIGVAFVIYPLASLIKSSNFNSFFQEMCSGRFLDHPVYAFDYFFLGRAQSTSQFVLIAFFLGIVVCLVFYNFLQINLTKKLTMTYKAVLENLRILIIFTVEIFVFDLKKMNQNLLTPSDFIFALILNCIGYFCFSLACVLIYEIFPIRIFQLDKYFGRYRFQVTELDEDENFDINQNLSQIDSTIYSISRTSFIDETNSRESTSLIFKL